MSRTEERSLSLCEGHRVAQSMEETLYCRLVRSYGVLKVLMKAHANQELRGAAFKLSHTLFGRMVPTWELLGLKVLLIMCDHNANDLKFNTLVHPYNILMSSALKMQGLNSLCRHMFCNLVLQLHISYFILN